MFNEQLLHQCRTANLSDFIMRYDRNAWRVQGKYLRNIQHDSCVIDTTNGFWYWNSIGAFGHNLINFLQVFYGLSFSHAVKTICSTLHIECDDKISSSFNIKEPSPTPKPWPELYNYLCTERAINASIIDSLISSRKIFLSEYKSNKNIVFQNSETRHYEIIGIGQKRFKVCSDSNSFWYFNVGTANSAYICESAIDAISLYQLTQKEGIYISVCGSSNRIRLITKITELFPKIYLALDNDAAGHKAASMLPDLSRLIPKHKDWNEDLTKNTRKE